MDFGTSAFLVVSGLGDDFSVGVLDGVGRALAGYSPGPLVGSSHPMLFGQAGRRRLRGFAARASG
jgi:hypothetical protein